MIQGDIDGTQRDMIAAPGAVVFIMPQNRERNE
jgi:hypothetical protein